MVTIVAFTVMNRRITNHQVAQADLRVDSIYLILANLNNSLDPYCHKRTVT